MNKVRAVIKNTNSDLLDTKKLITIFTDGSSKGNGKKSAIGGIGVYFCDKQYDNVSLETSVAIKKVLPDYCFKNWKVTNNISELTAVLVSLDTVKDDLKNDSFIVIKSDSKYTIDSLTKWYPNWIKNGYRTAGGKPISNKEIIQEILEKYIIPYKANIRFFHVLAHRTRPSGNSPEFPNWYGNFMADKLSNEF